MLQVKALSILVFTVGLSLARPRVGGVRIRPQFAAMLGALLTIGLGLLTLPQAARALGFLALPLLTIVSLMVTTLVAEEAGLFRLVSWRVARLAGGKPQRLFALLFFTGTVTGAVFTNDAAVLIFTPLVYRLVEEVGGDGWGRAQKIPFYFAVLYVANLVGPLVISNPINIIVAGWFDIGFLEYAKWMALPALVSILVTYAGLWFFFRKDFPRSYTVPEEGNARPGNPLFFWLSVAALGLTLFGFFTEGWTGVPTAAVAAVGAFLLLLVYSFVGGGKLGRVVQGVGWDVVLFVIGIFVVASGLRIAGITELLGSAILSAGEVGAGSARTATAFLAGGASAVLNNHPVAQIMAFTIRDLTSDGTTSRVLAMAALIGGDLGPKMLPIGSLAALMWFRMLRDRGVKITYREYVKIGVPVTLAAILLSVLTLNLQALVF